MREFDLPWQHRTTVVLDLSAATQQPAAFERTVSVAASLVELAARRGELVRLVTTAPDAAGTGAPSFVAAQEHLDALMDRLAAVTLDERATPGSAVEALRLLPASGRLVVCTGRLDGAQLGELDRAAARFGLAVIVTTEGELPDAEGTRARLVRWDGTDALEVAWATQLGVRAATAVSVDAVGGPR